MVAPQTWGVGDGGIAKWCKAFDELVVCNDTSLGEAIHAASNFDVDKTVVDQVVQAILLDDFVRQEVDGEAHVFVSVHGCAEVVVLEVNEDLAGPRGRDSAVDDQFGGGEIRGVGADVEGIIDEVATDGETGPFWFGFLGAVIANDAAVGDRAVRGNRRVWDEEDGVGAFDAVADALG